MTQWDYVLTTAFIACMRRWAKNPVAVNVAVGRERFWGFGVLDVWNPVWW